jgi:hypothetical protein
MGWDVHIVVLDGWLGVLELKSGADVVVQYTGVVIAGYG